MSNPLFEDTVTVLLEGNVICPYRYETLFGYLADDTHRAQVNDWLRRINRQVRTTSGQDAYLCAFVSLESAAAKDAVRRQFQEVVNHLEPLVFWLQLAKSAGATDRPVMPGDPVRESELLAQIEMAPHLQKQLAVLIEKAPFQTKQSTSKGQLSHVLKRLVEMGYLLPLSVSGALYQATGRWSLLYDLMAFIQQHETIEIAEDDGQIGMFDGQA